VFERCGSTHCVGSSVAPIVKLDPAGKQLRTFGAGMFVMPHGLYIDNDNNVWVTDADGKDGKGHQVFKFSAEGKLLMTLGKAGVAGNGPDTFNRPSDVVIAPNGAIFVADGHGGDSNARIVKLDKSGKFIKAWGRKGSAHGEFDTPHALAIDSKGRLLVGDRGNSRVQIFDQDGRFLEELRQFGRPSGIFVDRNDVLYVTDHQSDDKVNPGFKRGIYIGSLRDKTVTTFIPAILLGDRPARPKASPPTAHGNVFGAETNTQNLRKYVKGAGD
jgi:DNA-binding beta-propeller fold protein YncE